MEGLGLGRVLDQSTDSKRIRPAAAALDQVVSAVPMNPLLKVCLNPNFGVEVPGAPTKDSQMRTETTVTLLTGPTEIRSPHFYPTEITKSDGISKVLNGAERHKIWRNIRETAPLDNRRYVPSQEKREWDQKRQMAKKHV